LREKKRSKNDVFIPNSALDVLVEKCDSFVAILILYVCPILKSLFTNCEQRVDPQVYGSVSLDFATIDNTT